MNMSTAHILSFYTQPNQLNSTTTVLHFFSIVFFLIEVILYTNKLLIVTLSDIISLKMMTQVWNVLGETENLYILNLKKH